MTKTSLPAPKTKGAPFKGYLFVSRIGYAATWGAETPYAVFEDGGSGEKLEWTIGDTKARSAEETAAMLKPFAGTTDPVWVEAFLYEGKGSNRTMRRVSVTL